MEIQKLQRAIIDGLEDVKAQDIKVFNTTHLTALFDRVIVASGTSNRQTKALANSVRDKVKELGGDVLSTEGEEIGEWVLVDCGDAVVPISLSFVAHRKPIASVTLTVRIIAIATEIYQKLSGRV